MLTIFKKCILACLLVTSTLNTTIACTRVMSADNGHAVLVGRTMDWYHDMPATLVVYPRGIQRDGMTKDNSLQWTSRYGSIVAAVFGATTDGMNEKGLAAHVLWLDDANYGERDTTRKGLSVALWAQYYLDQFKTVREAVDATQAATFQLETLNFPGSDEKINLHLALEDASGDSAIIEYTNGQATIYHDKKYAVLTNAPTFNKQLKNLLDYKGFGGDKTLPGTTDSKDRFVRASYYTAHLPQAQSTRAALTHLLSVVDNVTEPFGVASEERPEIEPTLWRTVADLTHKTYYFNAASQLHYVWVNLSQFELSAGNPIKTLDLTQYPNLSGNVYRHFK